MATSGWILLYIMMYLAITTAIAEILSYRGHLSLNFMQLKHPADWVILITVLATSFSGIGLLIGYYHRAKARLWFWLGQLGALMVINGVITFVGQTAMARYAKLTRSNVKNIIQLTTSNYIAEYILLVLMMVGMIWLNHRQGWLTRNNWYYFWTMAPYIIEIGVVYHYQLGWEVIKTMKGFSANRMYDMLSAYQHYDNTVSILLMDNSTDPTTIILGLAAAAVIYIGGEYLVWKWQKAFQSRKTQVKGK